MNIFKKNFTTVILLVVVLIFSSCIALTDKNGLSSNDLPPKLPESPAESPSGTPEQPTPTDPAPTDPAPTDPEPTEPEPTDPVPTDPEPTEPEPISIPLKIGSFNIANGSSVQHYMRVLGQDIKNAGLDIVALQEVDQFVPRSKNQDTIKLLSEYSGLSYYAFFKAIDLNGGEYGVGILSRYPILETSLEKLYSGDKEQRVIGGAKIDVNGTIVNFFSTHLSFESKSLRDRQFAQIYNIVKELDNFIVAGDFNTSDFSEYSIIKNAEMVNNSKYSIFTFPATSPSSSIDNIVYSVGSWTFEKPQIVKNQHSDHCMLYAEGVLTVSQPSA